MLRIRWGGDYALEERISHFSDTRVLAVFPFKPKMYPRQKLYISVKVQS